MNSNSEKNSNKEKEAEIAANRLVEMMEQQALYARIAKINEETKFDDFEEGEENVSFVEKSRPSKLVYLKWIAAAASLVIGGFLFFMDEQPSTLQISTVDTGFRGMNSIQSRSLINGKEVRTDFADIDDLIDAGDIGNAKEQLLLLKAKAIKIAPITFRQGIIAYQAQDFATAAEVFRKTVDSSDLEYLEDAYWNLMLSHKELGDIDAAKLIAQEMAKSPHITKKQKVTALELVDKLAK